MGIVYMTRVGLAPSGSPVQYSAHGVWDRGSGEDIHNQGLFNHVHIDLIIIVVVILGYSQLDKSRSPGQRHPIAPSQIQKC